MTDQNSTGNSKHRPEDLIEKYGIKTAAYYRRLKFLGIEAAKDDKGKAYLTGEQVEIMDALHEYIANNGKMEGFKFSSRQNSDAPSEPAAIAKVEDEQPSASSGENEEDDSTAGGELAIAPVEQGAIASTTSNEKPDSVIEQEIPQTQPNFSEGMEGIIRQAAEIKAQGLAMPDLVALQLSSQMTFDDLPEDLQQKVSAVKEAASPKMNPASVASDLLAQYRATR